MKSGREECKRRRKREESGKRGGKNKIEEIESGRGSSWSSYEIE